VSFCQSFPDLLQLVQPDSRFMLRRVNLQTSCDVSITIASQTTLASSPSSCLPPRLDTSSWLFHMGDTPGLTLDRHRIRGTRVRLAIGEVTDVRNLWVPLVIDGIIYIDWQWSRYSQ
jgi:hypothetical protein